MILTLPVSHVINENNYSQVPGIRSLEYRKPQPLLNGKMESLFHSNYGIIQNEFIDYFDSILDYLLENKIKIFSFDLGPAAENVEIYNFYYCAKSKILSIDELHEKIHYKLKYVKNKFHGDIALENLNYFYTNAYSHVCRPDFISEVIRKNSVYLVLDIAHAIVSAHNMEIDITHYLSALPLDRVKVIHLSAPDRVENQWQDLHKRPKVAEFEILSFILSKVNCSSSYLIVEYYENFSEIMEIYKSLMEIAGVNIVV